MTTLGEVALTLNGTAVEGLASRKAEALLIYLACDPRPHPREILATLLWDDRTTQRALANLSVLLSSLRKQLAPWLHITRQTIAFNAESDYWLDAAVFTERVTAVTAPYALDERPTRTTAVALAEAVELYGGDFLAGFYMRDASGFEEWRLLEQERLRGLLVTALSQLVAFSLERGQVVEGIAYARRLVHFDPLQEEAQRRLMLLLALDGQKNAALAQYEACRAVLEEELGVPPAEETTALYEQIVADAVAPGDGGATAVALAAPAGTPAARHNLPAEATAFVGREAELALVAERLNNPDCRLLTLTGPGGVGKTRLALHAAWQQVGRFLDGVWFVSLAGLQQAAFLVTAVADAIGFSFAGTAAPREELVDFLRDKEMLLMFDNFEHLLGARGAGADAAIVALLRDVVQHAPEVKLVATSRERLNLQAEWLLVLDGLPYPADVDAVQVEQYAAVQLFLQRADQTVPGFAATAAERPEVTAAIIAICRLVVGMPLAIELAVSWLRTLSVREIQAAIEANVYALETALRDVPARHRSLRAVFDYSWSLLEEAERDAFCQLVRFRGGFTAAAALDVAQTSPLLLTRLVDKSLLQRVSTVDADTSRYAIHELLRQFGAQQLAQREALETAVAERHARYFAAFLAERATKQAGAEQVQAMNEIAREIDNIRAAWHWAMAGRAAAGRATIFTPGVWGLLVFFDVRGRYAEGLALMRQAHQTLRAVEEAGGALTAAEQKLLGRVLAAGSWFRMKMGDMGRARTLAERALATLQPLDDHVGEGYALLFRGAICYARGDFATAVGYFQAAVAAYAAADYLFGVAGAEGNLAEMGILLGDLALARAHSDRSVQLAEQLANPYMIAHNVERAGQIDLLQGDLAAAERAFQRSLAVARELNEAYMIANTLESLGNLAVKRSDYPAAREYFREGVALARKINNPLEIANMLTRLGETHVRLRETAAAQTALREALGVAQAADAVATLLDALMVWAQLALAEGDATTAVTLAHGVVGHGSATQETRAAAEQLLARAEEAMEDTAWATAVARGREATPEALVEMLWER